MSSGDRTKLFWKGAVTGLDTARKDLISMHSCCVWTEWTVGHCYDDDGNVPVMIVIRHKE